MKSALRRTGLSADVLRSWETRYRAISPERSAGGHRLYSEADIDRLILLQRLLALGRRIGQLAPLRTGQLRTMLTAESGALVGGTDTDPDPSAAVRHAALEQASACDGAGLTRTLQRAVLTLRLEEFLDHVVVPLLEAPRDDQPDAAGRRLAGGILTAVLTDARRMLASPSGAPRVVVATTEEARDDVGLHLLATAAAAEHWDVVFLGTGVSADAIADAAMRAGARVVAVWLAAGEARGALRALREIQSGLPAEVALLASGPGAAEGADELAAAAIGVLPERRAFVAFLESFR